MTRAELIKRTLYRMGTVRVGADVPGAMYEFVNDSLTDLLYEINEDISLDFDLTEDEVPEERAASLANLLRYSPALDVYDTKQPPAERSLLFTRAHGRFIASVIGESNYVEDVPRDY